MASKQGFVFKVCIFAQILDDDGNEIQKLEPSRFKSLLEYAAKYYPFSYFAILHDVEEHDEQRLHYHLVIEFERKKTKGGALSALVSMFRIANPNAVSVDFSECKNYDIRYLTHETPTPPDELPKHVYPRKNVITNDNAAFIGAHDIKNLFSDVVTLANGGEPLSKIIRLLGYRDYMKYRAIINDIRRENGARRKDDE